MIRKTLRACNQTAHARARGSDGRERILNAEDRLTTAAG